MKLYGRWTVTLPGEVYEWCPDDTTLVEELMLEGEHGMTFDEWVAEVDDRKAIACQVLIWFLRRKADPAYQEERFAVDFPIRRLRLDVIAEPEGLELPPTPAASEPSDAATSSPSPAATGSDRGSLTDLLATTSS